MEIAYQVHIPAEEAAAVLGISRDELEQLRRRGEIEGFPHRSRFFQVRPNYIYDKESVLEYRAQQFARNGHIDRLAEELLTQAMEVGASEIHVEPMKRELRVRFRIDGVMKQIAMVPPYVEAYLTRHLMILATVPHPHAVSFAQSGMIPRVWNDREYQFHVSVLPTMTRRTPQSVKLVIHLPLADGTPTRPPGFSAQHREQMIALVSPPRPGLTVFATPHDEGLTALIRHASLFVTKPENNVYFFTESTEIPIKGVTRVIIDPSRGMTIRRAVESALHQDANVLIFHDIHDRETAQIAVDLADAGHAVWAGVRVAGFAMGSSPSESARSLSTRFQGFQIAPDRWEAVCIGVVLGRMACSLCAFCKQEVSPNIQEQHWISELGIPVPPTVCVAGKCSVCENTGYTHRTGMFVITRTGDPDEVTNSFRYEALSRFASGEVDVAELRRLRVANL